MSSIARRSKKICGPREKERERSQPLRLRFVDAQPLSVDGDFDCGSTEFSILCDYLEKPILPFGPKIALVGL